MSEWVRKNGKEPGGGKQPPSKADEAWMLKHPALVEFMTLEAFDDGQLRQTTTVLLFSESGVYKACVSDRDGGRVAFVTAGGLVSLLDAVEAGLQQSSLDWRPARKWKGK